ncbi:hypothetical protein [Flavobacterium sp.]|uniref:hypothetical protein n=1 Tax=Flavobacterium sp. TaxID=239 RepID=UPI00374CE079
MNTSDQNNSMIKGNKDPENQNPNTADRNDLMNEELYDIDDIKETDDDNSAIAERGYTVRNGHNPDTPNPDELTDDEEDLTDDFHSESDLNSNTEDLYEEKLDNNGNNVDAIDELDNPSEASLEREDEDFNETEDVLEDIDDEEEENDYVEDDVQEEEDTEYPDNDPRKF